MRYPDYLRTALLLGLAGAATPIVAQEAGDDDEAAAETIAELTENSERFDGLFTLYRDRETGQSYLEIGVAQLDQ
jgi:hypothetical protein